MVIQPTWSEEDLATIRRMLAEACSFAVISRALEGRHTRAAVIGKARRLGLRGGIAPGKSGLPGKSLRWEPRPKLAPLPRLPKRSLDFRNKGPTPKRHRKPKETPIVPEITDEMMKGPANPRPLWDTQRGRCMFPMWPHGEKPDPFSALYCQEINFADKPFCALHSTKCYEVWKRISK